MAPSRIRHSKTAKNNVVPPAATAVLATAELFENIMLHVQLRDLFAWQRVCADWSKKISGSQTLQKNMYLLADGDVLQPVTPVSPARASRGIEHPPGSSVLVSSGHGLITLYRTSEISLNPATHVTRHSIKGRVGRRSRHKEEEHTSDPAKDTSIAHFGINFALGDKQRVGLLRVNLRLLFKMVQEDRKEASWRRMFVTQPPITDSTYPREKMLHKESGLTLGDIYDQVLIKRAKAGGVYALERSNGKDHLWCGMAFEYPSLKDDQFVKCIRCDGTGWQEQACACLRALTGE